MKRVFLAALTAVLFLYAGTVFAEEDADDLSVASETGAKEAGIPELESVVIKAQRTGSDFRRLPVSAAVLKDDDIELQNAKQTTDLLNILPGVFIRRTSAFGRADVDIRGIGGNGRQLGILIDGRPDKMGLFGCSVTHTLPFNNVESVELIRGPESVLYGSEAFGGIVNIVTKRPRKSVEGNVTASYGAFNTQNYKVEQGGRFEKSEYYITMNKQQSDGHKINSRYDANDFTGRFGYEFSGGPRLFFGGKYFTGIKNEPQPAAVLWNDYRRGSADLSYDGIAGRNNLSLKYYRSFGEHKFSDGFHSTDYTDGIMAHDTVSPVEGNKLNFGLDMRYQSAEVLNLNVLPALAKYKGQYHKYEYGFYLNDDHTFLDKITVTLGARYNTDEISGGNLTTKAGVVYAPGKEIILRALRSGGFRSPQLNDLYFMPVSNPELKPERVVNNEVGIRYFMERLNFDVTGFIMDGEDLIEVRAGKNKNVGIFNYKGVEASAGFAPVKGLWLNAGYTFTDYGRLTGGKPQDKAVLTVKYGRNRLKAMLSANYTARYFANDDSLNRIRDYTVMDMKLVYEIIAGCRVFAAIDNLTNQPYQIVYSGGIYDMAGRALSLGMSYGF